MRAAIITGASSGLGLECARALLRSDPSWHVVLPVRNAGRGAEAVRQLGEPQRCTVMPMDLASLTSVRAFVENVSAADLPPLHAIVCNAGVQVSGTEWTEDGFEMTFGVNHLGHFTLVQRLLDEMAHPARIVVVSSGTHDPTKHTGMPDPNYTSAADLAHPRADESAEGRRRYTTSKLCNLLFTHELDRRLGHGGQGVTVNAFDPGLMPGSGLARDYPRCSDSRGAICCPRCGCCPVSTAPAPPAAIWPHWQTTPGSTVSAVSTSTGCDRSGRRRTPTTAARRSISGRPANGCSRRWARWR
jgi:NAD(P)-dependent dehydrogenase (short-subunit alcohol dehydrogenase family)